MSGTVAKVAGAWECAECKEPNLAIHRQCASCKKWRDLDWACAACHFKNFQKRDSCKSCGIANWKCECGSANLHENRKCNSCEKWRDLDWPCTSCGFKNFAKRDSCKLCNSPNPVLVQASDMGMQQDPYAQQGYSQQGYSHPFSSYVPPSGRSGSYDKSQEYTRSQQPESLAAQMTQGFDSISGDSALAPAGDSYSSAPISYPVPDVGPAATEELPWYCGLCEIENTPKRLLCFECSGHRERVEVRNRAAENRLGFSSRPAAVPAPRQSLSRFSGRYSPEPPHGLLNPPAVAKVRMRPDGPLEDLTLDWHCGSCKNRNFAKRAKCNKCKKPREECEDKDLKEKEAGRYISLAEREPRRQFSRDISPSWGSRDRRSLSDNMRFREQMEEDRQEDRTQDWSCKGCQNRNWARRKECNKCKKPRDEAEDKEVTFDNDDAPLAGRKRQAELIMAPPSHAKHYRVAPPHSSGHRSEDLTNDWVCGRCNINCFAKKAACFRCGRPRSEVEDKFASPGQGRFRDEGGPTQRVSGHTLSLNHSGYSQGRGGPPMSQGRDGDRGRKWVDEDKSKDWWCRFCKINTFAKRTSCFSCKKNKADCIGDEKEEEVKESGEKEGEVAEEVTAE